MAPKLAKRPAAAAKALVQPTKKPRSTTKYEPGLVDKCSQISAALKEGKTLPDHVLTMLSSMVLQSLAQPQDVRHEYQQQVAGWIHEALVGIDTSLSTEAAEAQAKFDAISGEKPNREAAVAEAEGAVQNCKQKLDEAKNASSDADVAESNAASALSEAQTALETADSDGSKLISKKSELEKILAAEGEYTLWKTEQATKKNSDAFIKSLGTQQFEQALLKAITHVLVKVPDTRTEFDLMVLKQFEDSVQKQQSDLDVEIQGIAPKKEQCDAAVKDCASKHEAASAQATEKKACIAEAASAVAAAELGLKEARKSLRELNPDIKESQSNLKSAALALSTFKEGPLALFIELRDRTTPPPEPTIPDEESKDEDVEPAKVPEEQAEKPVEAVA